MTQLSVQVEKPSNIVRKLTVTVPAEMVDARFQSKLAEIQKTARLKGFRAGKVPLSVVRQYYGEDARHKVFHALLDESFRQAVRQENLKAVGRPEIDAGDHHHVTEGTGFTYTATVEVMPEVVAKNYTGLSVKKEKVEVSKEDVDRVLDGLRDSRAELTPISEARPAKKGDHADFKFEGGVVQENGELNKLAGMSGTRTMEIGSGQLIPGFEEEMVGMKAGETKTFRINFPADYPEKELSGKEAEFTVTINELKEKKLPELNDEFAKEMQYESLAQMREKADENLRRHREQESEGKLKNEVLQALIEKNQFDVPTSLIEAQARQLAQELIENLQQQRFPEDMIKAVLRQETDNLRKRADNQVRAGLLLDSISSQEDIKATGEDIDAEIKKMAESMRTDEKRIREYYEQNPEHKENLEFRIREEKTLSFLIDKAKVKEVKPAKKDAE